MGEIAAAPAAASASPSASAVIDAPKAPAAALMTVSHVAKAYRAAGWMQWTRREVLVDVSLEIAAGEIVGVTGENGVGKSTLLRILAGLSRPDAGTVVSSARLGYCPQELSIVDELTPEEVFESFGVGYGLSHRDIAHATRDYAKRLGFERYLQTPVSHLSEGTKQKVSVALALMHQPTLLLLDEPYAGFDYRTYLALWELMNDLAESGRGFLIVTHLIHERASFHRILRLVNGRCVADA